MGNLAKRIRSNDINSSKLKVYSNLFFLFWALMFFVNIVGKYFLELDNILVLLSIIQFILMIVSSIFLFLTLTILYISAYLWGNFVGYIISFFIPFGGFISFAIALSVFVDSKKVTK
jgi:hypothetical protein